MVVHTQVLAIMKGSIDIANLENTYLNCLNTQLKKIAELPQSGNRLIRDLK